LKKETTQAEKKKNRGKKPGGPQRRTEYVKARKKDGTRERKTCAEGGWVFQKIETGRQEGQGRGRENQNLKETSKIPAMETKRVPDRHEGKLGEVSRVEMKNGEEWEGHKPGNKNQTKTGCR